MWQQHSYAQKQGTGTLYLVPTPIGNLEDITYRAVRTLSEADVIAAEDTRQTKKLCAHFEIGTPLLSYHKYNKEQRGTELVTTLQAGHDVALVSDAGMPVISDPGFELVQACLRERLHVVALPGANAGLTALVASGLHAEHFTFYGFLPRGKKERKAALERLTTCEASMIFYEAPHRIAATLQAMFEVWGDRQVAVARELTKIHEEWLRGGLKDVCYGLEAVTTKGEFCIVVEGTRPTGEQEAAWWDGLSIPEHVEVYRLTKKEAIKKVASERGLPKRDVYNCYHDEG